MKQALSINFGVIIQMKIFASLLDETLKKSKLILAKISRKPQNV